MRIKFLIVLCSGTYLTIIFTTFGLTRIHWFVIVTFYNFPALSICLEVYGDGEQEVKRGVYPYMVSDYIGINVNVLRNILTMGILKSSERTRDSYSVLVYQR